MNICRITPLIEFAVATFALAILGTAIAVAVSSCRTQQGSQGAVQTAQDARSATWTPTLVVTTTPAQSPTAIATSTATPTLAAATPTTAPEPAHAVETAHADSYPTVVPTGPPAPPREAEEQGVDGRGSEAGAYAGQCGPYDAQVTQWWGLINVYPWDACTVLEIIRRESRGIPWMHNAQGSGATGLTQILPSTWDWNNCTGIAENAADNLRCAYTLYSSSGWAPWAASGTY